MQHSCESGCDLSLSLWQRLFANHDAVGICAAWGCTANALRTVHGGKRYPYHRWKPPRWPARISATQHVLHAHQQHSMTCMHFSNTACPARTSATQHDLHAHQQHSRVGSGPDFYSPNCIATILPKLVCRRKDRTVHHSISKGVRLRQRQKAACSASGCGNIFAAHEGVTESTAVHICVGSVLLMGAMQVLIKMASLPEAMAPLCSASLQDCRACTRRIVRQAWRWQDERVQH